MSNDQGDSVWNSWIKKSEEDNVKRKEEELKKLEIEKSNLKANLPRSDKAFSEVIENFLSNNRTIKSANYWTLAEIACDLDPETWGEYSEGYIWGDDWGEDYDGEKKPFIDQVVETYNELLDKKGINEFLDRKIETAYGLGELENSFDIGENSTYPDEKSFYEDLDHEKLVEMIKQCWSRACLSEDEYSKL